MSGESNESEAATLIRPTEPGYWWAGPREAPVILQVAFIGLSDTLEIWHEGGSGPYASVRARCDWLEPVTSIQDVAALRLGLAHAQEDVRTLRQQAEEREGLLQEAKTDTSRARMEIDAARRVVYAYIPEQDDETPAEAVTRFIEGVREGRTIIDRVESERATAERNADAERLKTAQQAARREAERANDRAVALEERLARIDTMIAGMGYSYGREEGLVEHRLLLLLQEFRSTREALLRELSA